MRKLLNAIFCFIFCVMCVANASAVAELDHETTFVSIMKSIENVDYEAFLRDGDEAVKEGISEVRFQSVCDQVTGDLKQGFIYEFLGELTQQGYDVYLYKISFTNGRDDILAKLCIKDERVGGFWLQ